MLLWWGSVGSLLLLLDVAVVVNAFSCSIIVHSNPAGTRSSRIFMTTRRKSDCDKQQQRQKNNHRTTAVIVPWLIVGGGIHGVHIAARLLDKHPRCGCTIVDDRGPQLLQAWRQRTRATGMVYLRSASSHHLDVPEESLRRFAGRRNRKNDVGALASDYQRPRLDVFEQHCDSVIAKYGLTDRHVQGRVVDIRKSDRNDGVLLVEVLLTDGQVQELQARNVVLALGNPAPLVPDWVTENIQHKVRHILKSKDHARSLNAPPRSIAIVGGGMSAAQLALQYSNNAAHHVDVYMISQRDILEQQFDTHQDWMMESAAAARSRAAGGQGVPGRQREFAILDCPVERRRMIQRERQSGTVTAAVHRGKKGLRYAIEEGRIQWHAASIISATECDDTTIRLSLSTGQTLVVDQIILATGFGSRDPPGKELVQRLARRNGVALSPCGYPMPDRHLHWHDNIFVTGALAELEIGPSARNIAGARMAAERIAQAAASVIPVGNDDTASQQCKGAIRQQ